MRENRGARIAEADIDEGASVRLIANSKPAKGQWRGRGALLREQRVRMVRMRSARRSYS